MSKKLGEMEESERYSRKEKVSEGGVRRKQNRKE